MSNRINWPSDKIVTVEGLNKRIEEFRYKDGCIEIPILDNRENEMTK